MAANGRRTGFGHNEHAIKQKSNKKLIKANTDPGSLRSPLSSECSVSGPAVGLFACRTIDQNTNEGMQMLGASPPKDTQKKTLHFKINWVYENKIETLLNFPISNPNKLLSGLGVL